MYLLGKGYGDGTDSELGSIAIINSSGRSNCRVEQHVSRVISCIVNNCHSSNCTPGACCLRERNRCNITRLTIATSGGSPVCIERVSRLPRVSVGVCHFNASTSRKLTTVTIDCISRQQSNRQDTRLRPRACAKDVGDEVVF